jgi:hypothetical protein
MKTYQEFINEGKAIVIEELAAICKKIISEVVAKVGIPLGLAQQAITVMENPFPHIHCQREMIEDGLDENNKFLADECCQTFSAIAKENELDVIEVKDGDEHGQPGDVLAKAEIVQQ